MHVCFFNHLSRALCYVYVYNCDCATIVCVLRYFYRVCVISYRSQFFIVPLTSMSW